MPRPNRGAAKGSGNGARSGRGTQILSALIGGGAGSEANPNFDPNFDPSKEGAYAYTTYGYDPKINYTDPALDTRGFLGKVSGQPDTAGKVNADYISTIAQAKGMIPVEVQKQQALAPGQLSTFDKEQNILGEQKKVDLQNRLGIEDQQKQLELGRQGNSLTTIASTYPGGGGFSKMNIQGGTPQEVALNYQNWMGNNAAFGAGEAPSQLNAGVSVSKARQQQSENERAQAAGLGKYSSTIGDLQGQGLVKQGQLGLKYADSSAASKNFSESMFPPNQFRRDPITGSLQYFSGDSIKEQSEPFVDPNSGKILPNVFTKKIVEHPAGVRPIVSPEEIQAANEQDARNSAVKTPSPLTTIPQQPPSQFQNPQSYLQADQNQTRANTLTPQHAKLVSTIQSIADAIKSGRTTDYKATGYGGKPMERGAYPEEQASRAKKGKELEAKKAEIEKQLAELYD